MEQRGSAKKAKLDSKEDTTSKLFKVEFPEYCSETHFIKLHLTQNGKNISDNFYINGKVYGNHQALKCIAKADVKTSTSIKKGADTRGNSPKVVITGYNL